MASSVPVATERHRNVTHSVLHTAQPLLNFPHFLTSYRCVSVYDRESAPNEPNISEFKRNGERETHDYEPCHGCGRGNDPSHAVEHGEDTTQQQSIANHWQSVGTYERNGHDQRGKHDEDDARLAALHLHICVKGINQPLSLLSELTKLISVRECQHVCRS